MQDYSFLTNTAILSPQRMADKLLAILLVIISSFYTHNVVSSPSIEYCANETYFMFLEKRCEKEKEYCLTQITEEMTMSERREKLNMCKNTSFMFLRPILICGTRLYDIYSIDLQRKMNPPDMNKISIEEYKAREKEFREKNTAQRFHLRGGVFVNHKKYNKVYVECRKTRQSHPESFDRLWRKPIWPHFQYE